MRTFRRICYIEKFPHQLYCWGPYCNRSLTNENKAASLQFQDQKTEDLLNHTNVFGLWFAAICGSEVLWLWAYWARHQIYPIGVF